MGTCICNVRRRPTAQTNYRRQMSIANTYNQDSLHTTECCLYSSEHKFAVRVLYMVHAQCPIDLAPLVHHIYMCKMCCGQLIYVQSVLKDVWAFLLPVLKNVACLCPCVQVHTYEDMHMWTNKKYLYSL